MIGVIGGSGFYNLFEKHQDLKVETPYGSPSDKIAKGMIANKEVIFLPRHGKEHNYPPHLINYRANIYALWSLGVKRIITVTAAGSLQKRINPGDFVVLDQFFDKTSGRKDTFFEGPIVTHISTADPYCSEIGKIAYREGKKLEIKMHPKGTVVVISGPRFSTKAESLFYTKMGFEVVNMTQYPEVSLAREKGMCYSALALITDYDAGIVGEGKVKPVKTSKLLKVFKKNNEKALKLVYKIIEKLDEKNCFCEKVLEGAQIS